MNNNEKVNGVVNDLDLRSNDAANNERPQKTYQQHQADTGVVADEISSDRRSSRREGSRRVAIAVILTFWVLQYCGTTALVMTMEGEDSASLYFPRAVVSLGGALISFGMVGAQSRLRNSSLGFRAAVAAIMALIAPIIHFAVNWGVFELYMPRGTPMTATEVVRDYLWRLWIFASVSSIILALSYAADIREREERIRVLQELAHSAQLSALRNQLNPHFLFNALNSVAGLMSAKRVGEAETMTENLADFLRLTLALDPQKLITLDEELHLQNLYLSIEKVRFPGRLEVKVDVPTELRNALVPSLITQPLVENSIKYAVAKSTAPVELCLAAKTVGDQLELVVADSGGDAGQVQLKGARLGLRNVAERVRMHYGERGRFTAEAIAGGGFRNIVTVPLELAE